MALKEDWKKEQETEESQGYFDVKSAWEQSKSSNEQSSGYFDVRQAWVGQNIGNISKNIYDRYRTWQSNSNRFYQDYSNRFRDRKWNYEDAYVADSEEWMNTMRSRREELDKEAAELYYLTETYGSYIPDKNFISGVSNALRQSVGDYDAIIGAAQQDVEYWKTWDAPKTGFRLFDDTLANVNYGQVMYTKWQEERRNTDELLNLDIPAAQAELTALKQKRDAYVAERNGEVASIDYVGDLPDDGSTPYDDEIAALEQRISDSEYLREYTAYADVMGNSDYATGSRYISTANGQEEYNALAGMYVNTGFDDIYYDYINRNPEAEGRITVNDVSNNAAFLGLDKSFLQTMTEDEIGIFNYLYATQSPEKAYEYINFLTSELTARDRALEQQEWAKYADEHPVKASIFSTLISPMKGLSYLGQAADYLDDGSIDQNAAYNKFSYIPSTIRGTVSEAVKKGWSGEVGSFLYNTGMSMADFLYSTGISGGNQALTLAIMGTGAAADSTIAAKDRGLSDDQAFAIGTIAGIAEVAMEKISLGAWLEGDLSEGALKYLLKNALSEGGEEVGTDVINLLADVMIAGDKSEWKTAMNAYIAEGKTEAEAFGLVAADQALQMGMDFLGGALSGAVIAGGTYAGDSIAANHNYGDIAKNGDYVNALVSEALEIDPNNPLALRMQGQLLAGKNVTALQVQELIQQNESGMEKNDRNAIQTAAGNRLTALGETGDVSVIAAALAKQAVGETLTIAERRAIRGSKYGARVANELNIENIDSGDFSSDWAQRIGTDRINADSYGRLIQDLEAEDSAAVETDMEDMTVSPKVERGGSPNMTVSEIAATVPSVEAAVKTTESSAESAAKPSPASETPAFTGTSGYKYNSEQARLLADLPVEALQNALDAEKMGFLSFSHLGISDNDVKKAWVDAGLAYEENGGVFPYVQLVLDERDRRRKARTAKSSATTTGTVEAGVTKTDTAEAGEDTNVTTSIHEVAKSYGKQSGAVIAAYNLEEGKQDVAEFDAAYRAAYDMGMAGVSFAYAKKSNLTEYLTDTQKEWAYNAGADAATEAATRLSEKNAAKENRNTGRKKGTVRGENVSLEDLKKRFNDAQNTAYKVLSFYAEATGIDIVLYKSEADAGGNFQGAQGRYKRSEPGTIYIDINAGLENIKSVDDLAKYTMLRTFAHEFTHFIENWNPVQYNEFRKVVFDTLTARGENVQDLIEAKQAKTELSYDMASREVVAEAMTDILPDSKFAQELAENHKSIFQKLLDMLKEFLSDIQAAFNGMGGNRSKEANALKQQVGDAVHYLENIVEMFDRVAVQAVENYQKTVAVEENAAEEKETTTEKSTQRTIVKNNVLGIPVVEQIPSSSVRGIVWSADDVITKTSKDYTYKTIDAAIVGNDLYFRFRGTYKTNPQKQLFFVIRNFRNYTANEIFTDVINRSGESHPYPLGMHFEDIVRTIFKNNGLRQGGVNNVLRDVAEVQNTESEVNPAESVSQIPDTITSENGYTITDNASGKVTEIRFKEKPSSLVREALKNNAFVWSKTKSAWTRSGKWYGKTKLSDVIAAIDQAYAAAYKSEAAPSAEKTAEEPKSDFAKSFENASQAENDEVIQAMDENMGKISHVFPTELRGEDLVAYEEGKKEVANHGKESEIGTDTGTVEQPVLRSEGAARLLEGVESGTVQRGSEGREPVRSGEQQGPADAGRDGRADAAGPESVGSTSHGVGRDLQQLSDTGAGGERPGTGLPGTVQTERPNDDGRGTGRLDGEPSGLTQEARKEALHEEVQREIQQKSTVEPKGSNFVIGDSLDLPKGTKARTRANIDAIRLVKQLQAEDRAATAEEQVILSKYVGWGGLPDAFGKPSTNMNTRKVEYIPVDGLEKEFAELKDLLTEEEYRAARESTNNAHYTSIEVIKAMYDGLAHLGFTGGRMLEPSSGVGNFVGAMPPAMTATVKSWTMVELDTITGQIAKYLYPHADVRIQGFEETNLPDGYMDVAIGNVPFGDYGITDKHYPKTVTKAIHNYFFAKALDKVRPGGLVMFITSSFTMDSRDSGVRKYIMERADLLGAVRLPNTAFSGNAGTQVVTDILILKKRAGRTEYAGEAFERSEWRRVDSNGGAYINDYFINHPEMVLGTAKMARGMYSANSLTYEPFTDRGSLGDQIRNAIGTIQSRMDYSHQASPEESNFAQQRGKKKRRKLQVENGVIFSVDEYGNAYELKADQDTTDRITGMVAIRDAYTALVDALQQGVIADEATRLRKQLNAAYDTFVKKYGFLNAPKNSKAIREFADRYSILSLENYNAEKKTAEKTDIFTKNTIAANRTAASAENVEEGLTISLNAVGAVDTSMIARLTGQKVEEVTRQLIDQRLVFKDKDGNLIPAVQYLSGNVRAKLREMEGLVGIDADYRNNVEALKAVVPETISYTDIYVNPGANWIPASVYEDFVGYILDRKNYASWRTGKKDFQVEYVPETNEYKVSINDVYAKGSAKNTQVWGEGGKNFHTIFENLLNGRRTNVYTDGPDGERVVDQVKTEAVNEKAEKICEEFRKWLWSDENRRAEMQELYNQCYNAVVTPKYSGEGLTVNGLNAAYTIRPHQLDAVARIINSGGNTLLAHRVGAGKTMEMAAAAMKLKQLGIIKKPMFVVPNNVVAQWGVEFKSYFPAANILVVGDTDMTAAERMTTINRIKNNDYDAVILAYTKFEKIQMSKEWRQRFYEEQIEKIVFAINAEKEAGKGKSFTVKQLEAKRKQLQNRIKKLTNKAKDEDGAMFEDLGVDALFVDEAHNFKNLEYTTRMSNVSGLGKSDGSQRAFDLYTKVRYLQELNGGRGIVFATATPVMNSMTEMYIMQRYLQPDTMEQLGIDNFDSWAKMFGEVVNALEIAPSGSGYRVKQTFSKFKNVKALQQLFLSFTDVLTDVPGLKIPKMKGGKVQFVECRPSEFQENYMAELAERADKVKSVDPRVDNMLKITSDGRRISYSQRMVDPSLPYEEDGKIYKCCENVFRVWQESKAISGTQMIFCDMATPKGKTSSTVDTDTETDEFGNMDMESAQLYDDMKARLIQLGIPEKEIAFIHDAKNDKQKAALAEKMNNGTIRVLIGSTGKMGVGLNAQVKAVAIHHLDAPWRPGDIEQRDGRVFRQKNQNPEAYKFVYLTKGSFDARLWDILERKQKFINQIMNGEDVGNEVEDTGQVTLSAAEAKAVASGNPLIQEEVMLAKELSKLESLQQAHDIGVSRAKEMIVTDERRIAELSDRIAKVQEDIKNRKDTYSDDKKFSMQIGSQVFTEKKEAGTALIAAAEAKAVEGSYTTIGKFAGFPLRVVKTGEGIKGIIAGSQNYDFKIYPLNPTYGINHLISLVEGLEGRLQGWKTSLYEANNDLKTQKQLASEPFAQAEKLREKRKRYQEVMDILNPPKEQTIEADDVQEQSREYLSEKSGMIQTDEQYQVRTSPLTDRDVLELAANEIKVDDLTDGEQSALQIFKNRLTNLRELQEQRAELGRLYREQQFGPNVDRAEAEKTRNRMKVLDDQIKKAAEAVLDVEKKEVLSHVLKKARKVVELKEREHGKELLSRYRARRNEDLTAKKYRDKIRKEVDELSKWVLKPDTKNALKHVPDVLKNPVISFLTGIDLTSTRMLRGGDATKADNAFLERLEKLQGALKANIDLYGMYSGYNDLPAGFMDDLQNFISTANALVRKNSGEFVINQMSSSELRDLYRVIKVMKTFITQVNQFHSNAMFQHVSDAGFSSIAFLDELKQNQNAGAASNFLLWQNMRPAYAFERFGDGGVAIYDELRQGQSKLAFNTRQIIEFAESAYTEKEVKAWEKEVKTLNMSWGKAKLTVAQMMGFYELSKQPDSLRHMQENGLRVATYKNGNEKISDVGHALTAEDFNTIIDALTPRQKEVADKLQQYMATQGAAWGNYVSVARFGEELFTNPHYYPINSDGRHLDATAEEQPSNASLYALLNMSFTKQRNEKANNRIVLYSIFDVFSNHMASMAQYNALALPVLDALKWFNYRQTELDEDGKKHIIGSVREGMAKAFGVPEETKPGRGNQGYAETFVVNIIKSFNGTEAQGTPNDAFGLKQLHTYNRAQVAYNLRVVLQQPLAITRAGLLLDHKAILRGLKAGPSTISKNIAEMQKYSGIAAWKDLGFYDVNISRGVVSLIKHDETITDKITEKGMWLAEQADKITWSAIWNACKEQVARKQGLKTTDDGFYEAVTKLFEDVIYKTQVVDSILTKNEYMRDKGFWSRMVSSFMSEPVTTISMVVDAFYKYRLDLQRGMTKQQAWKKNGKMIARTVYVYAIGAVLLAAVQAAADAWRDDDDYQSFSEKWLEAFGGNLFDELNPLDKLPVVSDIYEGIVYSASSMLNKFAGTDIYANVPKLPLTQLADQAYKAFDILSDLILDEDTNYTWYGGIFKVLQAVSGATGLPLAAATREVVSGWNNTIGAMAPSLKVKSYEASGQSQIKYAYQDGYLTEAEAIQKLIEQGFAKDEDEAFFIVQGWEGRSKYDDVYEAVKNGNSIDGPMQALLDHGYTRDEVISQVKTQIGIWYRGTDTEKQSITKQQAIDMLRRYTGMSDDEITKLVNKWSCKVVTGIEYDDIKQEYLDGNITAQRAVEMYMRYGGYTKEEAQNRVDAWLCEMETGIAYNNLKAEFLDGNITAEKAMEIYMKYGGYDQKEASEKVTVLEFVKENPEADGISYAALQNYTMYCESYGMEVQVYYDCWKYCNAVNRDDIPPAMKKKNIADYINALDISEEQRGILLYIFYLNKAK